MSDDPHSEQPNCNDDEAEGILPPDAHDLIETEQDLFWELDDWAAYKVTSKCRRDGCQSEYRSAQVIGQEIKTIKDYKTIAYQIYESYYDNPRTVPYLVLQRLIEIPDPGERNAIVDDLSDAAKLGCNDADADREKRPRQELFDIVLSDNL